MGQVHRRTSTLHVHQDRNRNRGCSRLLRGTLRRPPRDFDWPGGDSFAKRFEPQSHFETVATHAVQISQSTGRRQWTRKVLCRQGCTGSTSQSKILKVLKGWLTRTIVKTRPGKVVELSKARNLYNVYVQGETKTAPAAPTAAPLCPLQVGGSPSSTGIWQRVRESTRPQCG